MAFELRFGAQDVRVLSREAAFQGHFAVARLTLTPPLIITREQMDFAIDTISDSIAEAVQERN